MLVSGFFLIYRIEINTIKDDWTKQFEGNKDVLIWRDSF